MSKNTVKDPVVWSTYLTRLEPASMWVLTKQGGFQQGDSCFSKLMSDVAQHLLGVVLM